MICAGDKVSTDSCQVSSSYVYNQVLCRCKMGISRPLLCTLAPLTLYGNDTDFLGGNLRDLEKFRMFPVKKYHNMTI